MSNDVIRKVARVGEGRGNSYSVLGFGIFGGFVLRFWSVLEDEAGF